MKFDNLTGGHAISGNSYDIAVGYSGPDDVNKDRVKHFLTVDGTLKSVDYGSRIIQQAEFEVVRLTNSNFVDLNEFFLDNIGQKIKIVEEHDDERIFTEDWSPTTYYCRVLELGDQQEEDFSVGGKLFKLRVKLQLAGENSSDEQNTTDSSLIDALIDIDTIQADFSQSAQPTANNIGDRWFDTDDNKLYRWDGSSWVLLYTVTADDSTYGFVDGIFHLSAFADISQDLGSTPDTIDFDYVSGHISKGTIKPNGQSLDLSNGPTIAFKDGFSFSLRNDSRIWKFIIDNSINLFGAKCTLKFFKTNGSSVWLASIAKGKNRTNSFTYTDYIFRSEPQLLDDSGSFPVDEIDSTEDRYIGVRGDIDGTPVFQTYGEFEFAQLQDVSTPNSLELIIEYDPTDGNTYGDMDLIQAAINRLSNTQIMINKDAVSSELSYEFNSDQLNNINDSENVYTVQIRSDSKAGSSNEEEVRKITAIDDEVSHSGYYTLTIDQAFPTDPDTDSSGTAPDTADRIRILIHKASFKFQSGDQISGGFGLNDGTNFNEHINIYDLDEDGRDLIKIPSNGFIVNTDKNLVSLNPRNIIDPTSLDTYSDITFNRTLLGESSIVNDNMTTISYLGNTHDFDTELSLSIPSDFETEYTKSGDSTLTNPFLYYARKISLPATSHDCKPVSVVITKGEIEVSPGSFYRPTKRVEAIHSVTNQEYLQDNIIIFGVSFTNVFGRRDISTLQSITSARLVINFEITTNFFNQFPSASNRLANLGYKLILRFRRNDGSYIQDSNWEKDITSDKLGLSIGGVPGVGKLTINNFPDGTDLTTGFFDGETTLSSNYDHIIVAVYQDRTARDASGFAHIEGDLVWIIDGGGIGVGEIDQKSSSGWNEDSISVSNGELVHKIAVSDEGTDGEMFKVASGPVLDSAVDGTDYDSTPTLSGRELFNLSDHTDLFGSTPEWRDIQFVEFLLLFKDESDNAWSTNSGPRSVNITFNIIGPPRIYSIEEFDISERPLFASLRGKNLPEGGATYAETPELILTDILNKIYLGKWNTASLTSLLALPTRSDWLKWRKQFTEKQSSENVLKEILDALWAVAIFDEDDKIKFISLAPEDHNIGSPTKTFTDSDIIMDTWSQVKFRTIDEMYQTFLIGYNFFPPSKLSDALAPYTIQKYNDSGNPYNDVELQQMSKDSRDIYNLNNTYKKDFEYHYKSNTIDAIGKFVVKWFTFNSWEVEFDVVIDEMLGTNSLNFMDLIAIQSYFHTGDNIVEGFIISRKPGLYEGTVRIGVYIPDPLGKAGPICDPFHDALTTSRDISGWTEANGKIQDAEDTSRASIDTQYDAGTSPRTITC